MIASGSARDTRRLLLGRPLSLQEAAGEGGGARCSTSVRCAAARPLSARGMVAPQRATDTAQLCVAPLPSLLASLPPRRRLALALPDVAPTRAQKLPARPEVCEAALRAGRSCLYYCARCRHTHALPALFLCVALPCPIPTATPRRSGRNELHSATHGWADVPMAQTKISAVYWRVGPPPPPANHRPGRRARPASASSDDYRNDSELRRPRAQGPG